MSMDPVIAITMGDPAGIGPEVTAKALAREEVWDCCRPLVVGDAGVLAKAAALLAGTLAPRSTGVLAFRSISQASEARFHRSAPDLLDLGNVDLALLRLGRVSAAGGQASVDYIERAVELARTGQAEAIATGPINKAALNAAGIPYIGHTELLAALLGQERVTTMLATEGLRVVHVTRHVSLAEVASLITRERVLETIRLTHIGVRRMGLPRPR